MDWNVQFRCRLATVRGFRPSWGRSTGARSSEQLPASANRSSYRTGSGAPPLAARIRRCHTKVALSAVRAHRGSKGSNPSPSSGESCELRYRHRRPACLFGCGGRQVNMVVAGTERRYALAKENPMELSRIIASGTIGHSLAGGELSAISLIRLTNGPNRRFGIGTPSASRCRHPSDIDRVRTVQARNP